MRHPRDAAPLFYDPFHPSSSCSEVLGIYIPKGPLVRSMGLLPTYEPGWTWKTGGSVLGISTSADGLFAAALRAGLPTWNR